MAKNKNGKKSKKGKKKKNKQDVADIVSRAIGKLARKSTKKLIKSFEKRTGNLASKITPVNLLTAALENVGKSGETDTKQNAPALSEGK